MVTTFDVLHTGYVDERGVTGTVSLVVDGAARIVVDPGMVADREDILGPLREHGIAPEEVTHVFLTHHHPDHTVNAALFPQAAVVDFWASYHGAEWTDHGGDGHLLSPHVSVILTPGHTAEDATLLVETDDGVVACTHLWWRADRTPDIDPLADDQASLEASRARVLEVADIVVPGHGPPFRVADPSLP
jgi:glyoxylase-like metal-dependent hydrolase (beta-lactamase superfamily II)